MRANEQVYAPRADPVMRRSAGCQASISEENCGPDYTWRSPPALWVALHLMTAFPPVEPSGLYGTRMPDAETEEQDRPILFLYRRELQDSGGAGRWARGVGPIAAQITHGADEIRHDVSACGFAIPTSGGLFGGYPGAANHIV